MAAISNPLGNMPKKYGRAPKFYETDLDFNKRFSTSSEGVKIEFHSEFLQFGLKVLYYPINRTTCTTCST